MFATPVFVLRGCPSSQKRSFIVSIPSGTWEIAAALGPHQRSFALQQKQRIQRLTSQNAEKELPFSNVFFFVFGPLMMFLMRPYAQKRSRAIYGVSVLFMVIGLFSMYFHMTLSFMGQMLDEISILWLLASGYSVWMPRCYFPKFIKGNRFYFSCLVVMTTVISTFLTFVKPTINAYALNSIAIHVLYIVCQEYKKTSNGDLRHLIEVSVILWAIAMTSWISDRVLCTFWQRIHFFYLHSIWHVLISITFPYGIVTMALMDAKYEMPDQTLKVHYWPRDSWLIGLPYVEIEDNDKSC